MTSAPRSARIRPANAPRRSVSSTTRTWASGPATPIGALLPPHRLVAPIDEALVDVVLVRLARLRRRRPAPEERPQQAADPAAHRPRPRARPPRAPAPPGRRSRDPPRSPRRRRPLRLRLPPPRPLPWRSDRPGPGPALLRRPGPSTHTARCRASRPRYRPARTSGWHRGWVSPWRSRPGRHRGARGTDVSWSLLM